MCLLKSNYWSRCKPECFWETLCSAETSSKNTLGIKRLHYFLKKNNFFSLFGNFRVKNHFLLVCPVWDSLRVVIDFLSGNINIDCTWKIDVSWAKRFTFDIKLLGRPYMCIKNWNGHERDPYTTPGLISSQREFWPLKLFDIYYP